ncbi:hypothetical protein HK097_005257 [Rhizophlyctis rosea]|uniref:Uncharacterized protein n=1 Tax=Rhizophlyctis rosea TaxID=64517 RepID=A0AAD5SEE8_9FUNG|nr:hypothetical protein HK097_005257 [Rhizophlyctis rosea]
MDKQPRWRAYIRYKLLSNELFTEIKGKSLTQISTWSEDDHREYHQRLMRGYIKNKKCMEARIRYKFEYIPEALRNNSHEKAIAAARDNVRTYERLLGQYYTAKEFLKPGRTSTPDTNTPTIPDTQRPTQPSKRQSKPNLRKAKPPPVAETPSIPEFTGAEWAEFEQQTEKEVKELHGQLFSRIAAAFEEESVAEDIADAVADVLTNDMGALGGAEHHRDSLGKAYQIMKMLSDEHLRGWVALVVRDMKTNFVRVSEPCHKDPKNSATDSPQVARLPPHLRKIMDGQHIPHWEHYEPGFRRIRNGLNACGSEKLLREVLMLHSISADFTKTVGFNRVFDTNSSVGVIKTVHTFTLKPPLTTLQRMPLPDWGGKEFDSTPAYKLIMSRNRNTPSTAKPATKFRNILDDFYYELLAKLSKWAQTGDVPWEDAVLRPTHFLEQISAISMKGASKILREDDCWDLLVKVLQAAQCLVTLQLGEEGDSVFTKGFFARKPFEDEARYPNRIEKYVNARTEEEIADALTVLAGFPQSEMETRLRRGWVVENEKNCRGVRGALINKTGEVEFVTVPVELGNWGWLDVYFGASVGWRSRAKNQASGESYCFSVMWDNEGGVNECLSGIFGKRLRVLGDWAVVVAHDYDDMNVLVDLPEDFLRRVRALLVRGKQLGLLPDPNVQS